MQVANDYEKEVFNGDIGRVEMIDSDTSELTVHFGGREVTYACTIHKSQGSE